MIKETHLAHEGSEPVVETLIKFLLLLLHALRIGVDLQVEGREEALLTDTVVMQGGLRPPTPPERYPKLRPQEPARKPPADAGCRSLLVRLRCAGGCRGRGGRDAAAAGLGSAGGDAAEGLTLRDANADERQDMVRWR